MNDAAIIIIGNEILSGRTLDQNANFIAKRCTKIGLKISEIHVIPDIKKIIKDIVRKTSAKYKYVFVTGGIGPTHDDITAESIASAFRSKLILHKKAKSLLKEYYKKSDLELNANRMKMAHIPKGSMLIYNPVSAAPGFKIKNVWVMAGVPKIMQAMFTYYVEPKLSKKGKIFFEEIKIYKAEGEIAHILTTIQNKFPEIEIGSYPFMLPPKYGTNIVFKGNNKALIKKVIKQTQNIFKEKKIIFDA